MVAQQRDGVFLCGPDTAFFCMQTWATKVARCSVNIGGAGNWRPQLARASRGWSPWRGPPS
eukprot:10143689-Lingulodinium_polyedra.AAC.1